MGLLKVWRNITCPCVCHLALSTSSTAVLSPFPAAASRPEILGFGTSALVHWLKILLPLLELQLCGKRSRGQASMLDFPGEGLFFHQSSLLEFEELESSQRPGSKQKAVHITWARSAHLHRSARLCKGQRSKAFQKPWPLCACIIPPRHAHGKLDRI